MACGYHPLRQRQRKFGKGLRLRTHEEEQEAALAVQVHRTAHIHDLQELLPACSWYASVAGRGVCCAVLLASQVREVAAIALFS